MAIYCFHDKLRTYNITIRSATGRTFDTNNQHFYDKINILPQHTHTYNSTHTITDKNYNIPPTHFTLFQSIQHPDKINQLHSISKHTKRNFCTNQTKNETNTHCVQTVYLNTMKISRSIQVTTPSINTEPSVTNAYQLALNSEQMNHSSSYFQKVDTSHTPSALRPFCNIQVHDTTHLVTSTQMIVLDLWTNPTQVVLLLDA